MYSTETIDAAGEFYLVKIAGGGRFLIGLGSEADGDRTELASPGTNAAAGLKWSQAFYDYGTYTAPWTIYGSTPGLSYGPGWSYSSTDQQMRYNTGVQNELDNSAGAPGLRDGALFKISDDPRITRVGRVLRRFSIDELPQLFNVLKGEMSFVGPRPERPSFVDQLSTEIPYFLARHSIRPGITGWAQVNGLRGNTSIQERIKFDLYYLENWSIPLDVKILLKTFFSRKNAY